MVTAIQSELETKEEALAVSEEALSNLQSCLSEFQAQRGLELEEASS